jgi:hypothetical protein
MTYTFKLSRRMSIIWLRDVVISLLLLFLLLLLQLALPPTPHFRNPCDLAPRRSIRVLQTASILIAAKVAGPAGGGRSSARTTARYLATSL